MANVARQGSVRRFRSPLAKLVRFFERSRDKWKQKFRDAKVAMKRLSNQVRAVERSRARWRQLARDAQRRLVQLEREVEEQKTLAPGA